MDEAGRTLSAEAEHRARLGFKSILTHSRRHGEVVFQQKSGRSGRKTLTFYRKRPGGQPFAGAPMRRGRGAFDNAV